VQCRPGQQRVHAYYYATSNVLIDIALSSMLPEKNCLQILSPSPLEGCGRSLHNFSEL
jgi:hypothetical protein